MNSMVDLERFPAAPVKGVAFRFVVVSPELADAEILWPKKFP